MIFGSGFFAYHSQAFGDYYSKDKTTENFGTKKTRAPKIYGMVTPCPRSFDKAS